MHQLRSFLHEHSLSIFLFILWVLLGAAAYISRGDEWLTQFISNHAGDAFGAFVIVVATKYLIERGSAESKQDENDDD